jgi:hypothetical protein
LDEEAAYRLRETQMAEVFKVVFTGSLAPGINIDEAVREFASVFKVDEDKARALLTGGEARVLKADVDAANAERYLQVLGEIGLEARIEPADDGESDASEEAASAGDGLSAAASPASRPAGAVPEPARSVAAAGANARPAASGWGWIKQAWAQFRQQPRVWLAAVALVYLVSFVLSLVPVVGSLVSMILGPVFAGGLMLGAQSQQRGGPLRVGVAFDGFSRNGGQLALVGALYLAGLVVVFVAAGLVAMAAGSVTASSLEALSSNDPEIVAAAMGPGLILFFLIAMLFLVPLLMLYWFAPALVALDGMSAVEAMRVSFFGCLKNIVPFLVYGLGWFVILVAFSLLFGLLTALLGAVAETLAVVVALLLVPLMLVFAAVVLLSIYAAYHDVFHADEAAHGTLML